MVKFAFVALAFATFAAAEWGWTPPKNATMYVMALYVITEHKETQLVTAIKPSNANTSVDTLHD
jgi:hypothetical protein